MLSVIDNPWRRLPNQPDFVLPEDHDQVIEFNRCATPEGYFHLNLIPEPFLGLPDAPVVLLGLNPGYTDEDDAHHKDPAFVARSRANLLHRESQYPFFLLDPAITAPGAAYWKAKLRRLTEKFGAETIARHTLCVEFTPYHSVGFRHERLKLPSQQYSFDLVRQAVSRGAVIVIMRGKRFWVAAVPELLDYGRLFGLNSWQAAYISPGNCPTGFERICEALSKYDANS
jgi:hypothetical protein